MEFGAKPDISVVIGWTRLEVHYPSRRLAGKIYRNCEGLSSYKAHGIRLSSPVPGRPKIGESRDTAQDYRDERAHMEVERRFSLAKCKCGMARVTAKLQETAAHVIANIRSGAVFA